MPFNLLIIPLLGGYIFVRFWHFTKISMLRADKDRMLIRASLAGLASLVAAFPISIYFPKVFPCSSDNYCLYVWWKTNIPFEYMGISFLALGISIAAIPFFNFFCDPEKQVNRAIAEDADPMEIAFKSSKDYLLPLAFTLKNGKVYIGIVTHNFNPATPTKSVAIVPLQSGHRDPDTKRFILRNNYAVVIRGMRRRLDQIDSDLSAQRIHLEEAESGDTRINITKRIGELEEEWEDIESRIDLFEVVIPVSEIMTVFYFDERTYEEYFQLGLPEDKVGTMLN